MIRTRTRSTRLPFMAIILALAVLPATATWAQQVELVTFGSGLGRSNHSGRQITMSMGTPLVGATHSLAAEAHAYFGFWEMLQQALVPVAVGDELPSLPTQLLRNYPNPFNPSTRIRFTLADQAQVQVELYDLKGRKVDTLLNGVMPAGAHTITYQPEGLASGAYVVLMKTGSYRATQRMMLIK